MRRPSLPVLTALIAALAAIGLSALVVWNQLSNTTSSSGIASVVNFMPATAVGGSFSLTNSDGETVTDQTLAGNYSLLYFGYTYCPDVCPTELSNIAAALDLMKPALADQITPVFITIDPERDTPTVAQDYASAFHPRMIGLSGDAKSVGATAKAFHVYFAKVAGGEDDDYLMDHSGFVYLMGPDGALTTMFRPNADPERMASVLENFVERAG